MNKERALELLVGVMEGRFEPTTLVAVIPFFKTLQEPVRPAERGPKAKYPFASMQVGDVFDIPPGDEQPMLSSVRVYCSQRGRDLNRKFLCHRYENGLIQVYREK